MAGRAEEVVHDAAPSSAPSSPTPVPALRRVYTIGLELDENFHAVATRFFGVVQLPGFPSTVGIQIEEWQTHLVVRTNAESNQASTNIYGRPWSSVESWLLFEKRVELRNRSDYHGIVKILLNRRQVLVVLERPEPPSVDLEKVTAFAPALWPYEKNVVLRLDVDSTKLQTHRSESLLEPLLGQHYRQEASDVPWQFWERSLESELTDAGGA